MNAPFICAGAAAANFQQTRALSTSRVSTEAATKSNSNDTSSTSEGGAASSAAATTSFGYREVGVDEKEGMVRGVFERVAPSYDIMNDLMSGGVHRLWKDHLVSKAGGGGMSALRRSGAHPVFLFVV